MSSVDDETILEVLRTNDEPQMTTTEVAGQLPITRGTTRRRLQALADEDLITRERKGRNVVWWLPERTDEAEAVAATTDESDGDSTEESEGETAGDSGDESGGPSNEPSEAQPGDEESEATESADETEHPESEDEPEEESAAEDSGDEDESEEEPVAEGQEDESKEEPTDTQGETSISGNQTEPEVKPGEEEGIQVTTPDRETQTRVETLPEAPQDDRTVQAVLALLVLAVLYALVRRLRG